MTKMLSKLSLVVVLAVTMTLGLTGSNVAQAATTPNLGMASTFGILAGTYTNTAAGTTINGDLGYTTGPATAPTVTGTTHIANGTYTQAGVDQGAALTNLNSQACDYTFPAGAVDFATDMTHVTAGWGTVAGEYFPGVYCTAATSAASIGAGGITLTGAGTYIFRIDGAFTTVANSVVTLAGASACDVFWTPTAATTLGANSTLAGTVIADSGITIGSTVAWTGRALAFNGTVSTDTDTITAPVCAASGGIIRVVKTVVNDDSGTATAADFDLHVTLLGVDVVGSPTAGTGTPGTSYSLAAGTYVVGEDAVAGYTASFSGDCDASGNVVLGDGDDFTCTVTNNDTAAAVAVEEEDEEERDVDITVKKTANPASLPGGPGMVTYTYKVTNDGNVDLKNISVKDDKCSPVTYVSGDIDRDSRLDTDETWKYTCTMRVSATMTNKVTAKGTHGKEVSDTDKATVVVSAPGFPSAGAGPGAGGISRGIVILASIAAVMSVVFLARRKSAAQSI